MAAAAETTPAGTAPSDAAALRRQLEAAYRQRLDEGRRMVEEAEAALASLGAPAGPPLAAHETPEFCPNERWVSLKQAAHEIGKPQQWLRRRIALHSLHHPDRLPLAYQAGNMRNAPYQVPMGRLQHYLTTGE
ncbi:DUF1552 domain-containing protein [Methylobacterium currus]|uniref:DUF1552 domain-containing protein n=1 Tax=Methylobacterium currus TaxID=2051553 RepID=UPI001E5C4A03|nr:DUF1552 domain-containing protein [Methylobacterium currus]UHC14444.1 DUF1552 domain-containing protein [Methylobacterium currus]